MNYYFLLEDSKSFITTDQVIINVIVCNKLYWVLISKKKQHRTHFGYPMLFIYAYVHFLANLHPVENAMLPRREPIRGFFLKMAFPI